MALSLEEPLITTARSKTPFKKRTRIFWHFFDAPYCGPNQIAVMQINRRGSLCRLVKRICLIHSFTQALASGVGSTLGYLEALSSLAGPHYKVSIDK